MFGYSNKSIIFAYIFHLNQTKMNIQFSVYFTHEEVADLKEILKDTDISVVTTEPEPDSNVVATLVLFKSTYDFQRFCNALIRTGVQKFYHLKKAI